MTPKTLQYLLAVADHRNFTRAAEALGVSQPGLSQQIRQIEDSLGVVLFDRSGRAIRLTDAGETYIAHARRAMRELAAGERAVQDVADLSRGSVRLGFTPTFAPYLIGPLVTGFRARHPGIRIALCEMPLDAMAQALADGEIDLAIGFADGQVADLDASALFDERVTLVVGRGHRLAGVAEAITRDAFVALPLALLSPDFVSRIHVDAYFREQGITPDIAIEANSLSALIGVVRDGDVATMLPEAVAQAQPDVVCLALAAPVLPRPVVMLSRRGAYRRAAVSAFADHVDEAAAQWRVGD